MVESSTNIKITIYESELEDILENVSNKLHGLRSQNSDFPEDALLRIDITSETPNNVLYVELEIVVEAEEEFTLYTEML